MAILKPSTQSNMDTRPKEERVLESVVKETNSKEPLNNMMTVPYTISRSGPIGVIDNGGGFYALGGAGSLIESRVDFLYSPLSFGLNFTNNIKLSLNVSYLLVEEFPSATLPIAQSDYSIDFYYPIYRISGDSLFDVEFFNLNLPDTYFINPKFTLTYTKSTNTFSLNRTFPLILNLNDTIPNRNVINIAGKDYPDFSTDREKITTAQYQYFKENSFAIYSGYGYDISQFLALTGVDYPTYLVTPSDSNLAHFQFYISGYFSGVNFLNPFYFPFYSLNITYFGLTANYQPIN